MEPTRERSWASVNEVHRPMIADEIVVLPEQVTAPTRNKLGGARLLMAAALSDGIETFLKSYPTTGKSRRRLYEETAAWIFSDDCTWPFSFTSLCDALDVDAEGMRAALLKWKSARSLQRPGRLRERLSRGSLNVAA
jgi:hypothetical protein